MEDSYVCSGATMRCTMGTSQAKLTVLPDRTVYLTGKPMANISDHKTMVNLGAFGRCRSMGFPATASATAANHGTLTPMPCMHNTPFPWMGGKTDYLVKGQPALLKSSKCQCMWGGTISMVTDGQTDTGPADMSKKPKTFIFEKAARDGCNKATNEFLEKKEDEIFANDPSQRESLALHFHEKIKEQLGITTPLSFSEMDTPDTLGAYNPRDNSIKLNINYLHNSDCRDLLNTILHESRHAFQKKAVMNPDTVSVDDAVIQEWKNNMLPGHYVSPALDLQGYFNQPIEQDAYSFADNIIK